MLRGGYGLPHRGGYGPDVSRAPVGSPRCQPLPLTSASSRPGLALGSSTDHCLDQGSYSASLGLIFLVCQVG